MPKFKVGDVIIRITAGPSAGLPRTVIGHMSNGYVVYEYPSVDGNILLSSAAEIGFKLKPVKKEGWINVYPSINGGYTTSGIVQTTKEAAIAKQGMGLIDTIRIEWEE